MLELIFPLFKLLHQDLPGFWIGLKVYLVGGVEKWENRKNLVFPSVCLVGGVKKWEDEKLFYLVEEKNVKIKNVVYINRFICTH